jgi:hypothetical protein
VVVRFADPGAVKAVFVSPFQGPRFKNITVTPVDVNGDGVADFFTLSAVRNGKTQSTFLPA